MEKLAGNLFLKVIALIVAFLIWLLVTNTNNPVKTQLFTNVPINVVNQDSIADIGKVVEMEGSGTVTLKVKEKRSILERLSRTGTDFYVEADMENINQMNTVPLTVTCNNPLITWDEIEISPSSMKVTLENKVEQAFVVSVSTSGTVINGYEVGSTEILQGKNIYVAGPESVMKIINQVVAPVNVTGMNSDMTLASTLKVIDKNGSELSDSQMSNLEFKDNNGAVITDGVVQVRVDMWRVKTDIPIEVKTAGTPKFGYQVVGIKTVPVSISLAGTEEALEKLGDKFTLVNEISVAEASQSITQEIDITETLETMEGLKLISDADPNITVEVQIEKSGDTILSIPLASIDLVNKPVNMNLVCTPADKISIAVHALDSEAKPLTAEDVKVSVDLLECQKEGNYELPIQVELPDGYELAYEVTLIVNSQRSQNVETETEVE